MLALAAGHVEALPNFLVTSVGVVQCINIAMFTGGHHTARITEVTMITPYYSTVFSIPHKRLKNDQKVTKKGEVR